MGATSKRTMKDRSMETASSSVLMLTQKNGQGDDDEGSPDRKHDPSQVGIKGF